MRNTPQSILLILMLLAAVLIGLSFSAMAMPDAAQGVFATNTPVPTTQPQIVPDAPLENYALRLWLENDLLEVLFNQLFLLGSGSETAAKTVRLTQYELERRFPGAPTRSTDRERLLAAMLTAPRGTVDMRAVVLRVVEDALNANIDAAQLEINGFGVTTTPANIDGLGDTDAAIHIVYPADAANTNAALFETYVLALRDAAGRYRIVPAAAGYPSAPFGSIRAVELERLADVNRDGLDDLAIIVEDADVNRRLMILSYRNQSIIDLTVPGQQIRFGELVDWPTNLVEVRDPQLKLTSYRLESARWSCLSEITVTWGYSGNFYRSSVELNAKNVNQNSLGCTLYQAEPIFDRSPAEAIALIEESLATFSPDDPGGERAMMTLAMLYTLNGQISDAQDLANSLLPAGAAPSTWIGRQSEALIGALGASGNTVLDVCEALLQADPDGACDMDAVLGRIFRERPLTTGEDLVTQLETLGLPVAESVMIAEVGRVNRTAVSFSITASSWWAFAPRGEGGTYTAEQIDPPPGFEAVSLPAGLIEAPESALNALYIDDDPQGVLNVLETAEQNQPGIPLSAEARFLRALSYDLIGDRARARSEYFTLWTAFPQNIWGQLAARHLERR